MKHLLLTASITLMLSQSAFCSDITISGDMNSNHTNRIRQTRSGGIHPGVVHPCIYGAQDLKYDYNSHKFSFTIKNPNKTADSQCYVFDVTSKPYQTHWETSGYFEGCEETDYIHRYIVNLPALNTETTAIAQLIWIQKDIPAQHPTDSSRRGYRVKDTIIVDAKEYDKLYTYPRIGFSANY